MAPFHLQSPLGCLYLAAGLEAEHDVRVYDQNVDDERLETAIANFDPDVIGVSFTTGCRMVSLDIARRYGGQQRALIAGGIHPTYMPRECLDAGYDVVALGEVEDTLSEFLNRLSPERPFVTENYEPPVGYCYDLPNGDHVNTGIARATNVDRWAPARHLLPAAYHRRYSHGVMMGSRGCTFGCAFCASARTGFRGRDPKLIVDELEYIVEEEGHPTVHFADDIFTYRPSWVVDVCREIVERRVECRWSTNSRSDIPEKFWYMFDLMREAGCEMLAFGVEAADQEALKRSGKGLKLNKVMPVLQRARGSGIGVTCNLMAGLPGATYDDHLLSVDLMEAVLPNQISVSLTTPYPGTAMGMFPEKFGIRLKTRDWTALLQNVYLDADRFHDVIEFKDISTHEIVQYVDELVKRLTPYGYVRVKDDTKKETKPERIIKTFLDRAPLPRLRDTSGRPDRHNRSAEADWVL